MVVLAHPVVQPIAVDVFQAIMVTDARASRLVNERVRMFTINWLVTITSNYNGCVLERWAICLLGSLW